jgi:hypothetical protein
MRCVSLQSPMLSNAIPDRHTDRMDRQPLFATNAKIGSSRERALEAHGSWAGLLTSISW